MRKILNIDGIRLAALSLALLLFGLLLPVASFAQEAAPGAASQDSPTQAAAPPSGTPGSGDVLAEQQKALADIAARVDEVDKRINVHVEDDAALVDDRLVLEGLLNEALASGVAFRPRLSEISSRLEQLGPAPAAGQPAESDLVTQERQALTAEKAEINVLLGKAEDLSVRVNGLITKISNLRRELFTSQLTKRSELSDAIGRKVLEDIVTEGQVFWNRLGNSLRFAFRNKLQPLLTAAFLSLLSALVVLFFGRLLFGRLLYRDPAIENPNYISRLSVAFWSSLLPSLVLAICFLTASSLFVGMGVFTGGVAGFLGGLLGVIFLGFMVNRLSRAVLSPDMPNWRLLQIEPQPARTLVWLTTSLGVIVGLDTLASIISSWLGSPLSVTIIKSLFAAIISGVLIIAIARVKPFLNSDGSARAWPGWFRFTLLFLGIGSIVAAVSGYISLAQFVSDQIVVTGAFVTTAYIGLAASSAISEEGGLGRTAFGRWLKTENDVEDTRLDQLGVLFSVVINILIVVLFLPFVLFQWGFQPGDIATWLNRAAAGFQVGTLSFSPFAIVTGLGVFLIGYFVTRWFQRWLDGTVMARGRVDPGVRNSIRTVVGYAGLAIAGLIAVSAAGFNLSNVALIAGGLSLGIGFGLQNIVSNFVSGLILLAERPFKVGDWIETGAISGTVKKISVRATEIETFQRQTVIMPNSTFINGAVANWTHRNKLGRIEVPFGVVYASDPKHVHDVTLEIVRAHPMILRNPEPQVLFQGFTDVAMSFEARGFLADIAQGTGVRNDLRASIVETFRREGIALATTLGSSMPATKPEADIAKAEATGAKVSDKIERKGATKRPL